MNETRYTCPLDTPTPPRLDQVGGKARSLIFAMNANFSVPGGFVLSVAFFRPWLSTVKTSPAWRDFLAEYPDAQDFKSLCNSIKSFCETLELTDDQNKALQNALNNHPAIALFAVRSSSPEEDIDEASFAGEYETVLGVTREKLTESILCCFRSVFDERVVRYKAKHGMRIDDPRIAVIVQEQIASDVSGVAFSLNPRNNCYDEVVIDANYGLGETVVSGIVTPDAFVVDKIRMEVIDKKIAKKDHSLWLAKMGGTESGTVTDPSSPCLTDGRVKEIASMVGEVERYYQKPMDIEWAYNDKKLYLLQARPITGYFPLPDSLITPPGAQKYLYMNVGLVKQGITGLMSPMGVDIFSSYISILTEFLSEDITTDPENAYVTFKEGLMLSQLGNVERMMGRKILSSSIKIHGISVADTYHSIDMRDYLPKQLPKPLKAARWRMIWFLIKKIPDVISVRWDPERYLERYKNDDARQAREHDRLCSKQFETLHDVVDEAMKVNLQVLWNQVAAILIGARWSKHQIYKMFQDDDVDDLLVCLEMALPGNKTAEMGRMMYELAKQPEIQDTAKAETFVQTLNSREFSDRFLSLWDEFILRHGFRGMRELEISAPRTHENLTDLFAKLKDMSEQAKKGNKSVFEVAKEKRETAYKRLCELAEKKGNHSLQTLEKHYNVFIAVAGLRENPKYNIIRAWDLIRRHALRFGDGFVRQNRLDTTDDVFNLKIAEVDSALRDSDIDLRAVVERNTRYAKTVGKRREIPVFFDSRGRIFRPPVHSVGENALRGQPISPGVVTGRAKVLKSAHEKPILPGEILVAKATDPGWTPLFINAGAIILENGGMLQHGAVVAREYGKACVSSVVDATKKLKDGQLIEVDGSNGIVKILD